MELEKILSADILDILFDGRNKAYGAYDLRRSYPQHVKRSMIAILLFLFLLIGGYIASKYINPSELFKKQEKIVDVTTLEAPPTMDPKTPPPPPPPPPPPVRPTIRFVPPKIEKDELVKEEEVPPKQEELDTKTKISTETKEGDKDAKEEINTDLGEEGGKGVIEEKEPEIFTFVEQMPEFPGGEDALYEYLGKNIKYPPFAVENDIEGNVFVEFVCLEDGKISDAKVVRGIGGGCDQEALRVVKSMPNWKAGKQNGKPVRVKYSIPVRFKIQ